MTLEGNRVLGGISGIAAKAEGSDSDVQVKPHLTGIVHTAEADLEYEQFGQDGRLTPVIVLNGGPGFSHTYMYLTDVFTWKFAQNRTVTFYDQRGVGTSKLLVDPAPQGMPAHVADLEALRVELGYDKVDLIGHSWGGQIGMAYAIAYPEHVDHLVLVDSAAPKFSQTLFLFDQVFPDQLAEDEQFAKTTNSEPEAALHADLPGTVNRLFFGQSQAGFKLRRYLSRDFYSEERFQELLGVLSDEQIGAIVYSDVSNAVTGAVRSLDLTESLKEIKVPTLVMWGRFDCNVAVLTGWKISQAIPGAKMVIYSKSGHFPFYEEENAFLRDLNAFLGAS